MGSRDWGERGASSVGSRNKGEWRGSSVGSGERVKGEENSLEAARVAETRVSGGWQENGEKRQG